MELQQLYQKVAANTLAEQPELLEDDEVYDDLNRAAANQLTLVGGGDEFRGLDAQPMDKARDAVGMTQAFGLGFDAGSIAGTAWQAATDESLADNNRVHENYDPVQAATETMAQSDPEVAGLVKELLELGFDDPMAKPALDRLAVSNNWSHTRSVAMRYKQQKKLLADIDEAALTPWMFGMVTGVGLDVALTVLAARGAGAFGHAKRADIIMDTVKQARLAGAGRLGAAASIEGAVQTSLEMVTQDQTTVGDVLLVAGLSGLLGGALGGVAPQALLGIRSHEGIKKVDDMLEQAVNARNNSVGARETGLDTLEETVPVDSTGEAPELPAIKYGPLKGKAASGNLGIGKIPFIKRMGLRSPASMVRDIIAYAQNEKQAGRGSLGLDFMAWVGGKTYDQYVLFKDDFAGKARPVTLTGEIRAIETQQQTLETLSKHSYTGFAAKVYPNIKDRVKVFVRHANPATTKETGPITEGEFVHFGDLLAQAEIEGDDDAVQEIFEMIAKRVPGDQFEFAKDAILSIGEEWDRFYFEIGKLEAKTGLIDIKELKPGYRPQTWDSSKIIGDRAAFKVQLMKRLRKEPTAEWLLDMAESEQMDFPPSADGTHTQTFLEVDEQGNLTEGAWEKFQKENKNLADEWRAQWDVETDDARLGAQKQLEDEARKELRKVGGATIDEAIANKASRQVTLEKARSKAQTALDATFAPEYDRTYPLRVQVERNKLNTRLNRIDGQLEALDVYYHDLVQAKKALDANKFDTDTGPLDVLALNKTTRSTARNLGVTTETSEAIRKMQARLKKLERRGVKARERNAAKRLDQEAEDMIEAMVGHTSPGAFESDKLIQTSRHMKRRAINLKGVRHTKEWQQFMVNDPYFVSQRYIASIGRAGALRRQFVPFLRKVGRITDADDIKTVDIVKKLKEHMREEFRKDKAQIEREKLAGDITEKEATKRLKTLNDKEIEFGEDFDRMFGEITRTDYTRVLGDKGAVAAERGVMQAMQVTATTVLGWIGLSLLTDLAIQAKAGGRFATGFKSLFSAPFRRMLGQPNVFNELMKNGDFELAALQAGANVRTYSVHNHRFDIESGIAEYDFPGSKYRTMANTLESVAHVQAWANLMHPWNRIVRESFGTDFMDQIGKDLMNADKLETDMMVYYAKLGISKAEQKEMGELFAKHHKVVTRNLKVPDFAAWKNPKLEAKYKNAVMKAGNEAMMDPNIGDRPFLRRHIWGRVLLQFSSFMYTAGNNFIAPMVQGNMLSPAEAGKNLSIVMMAMGFAALGEMARAGRKDGYEGFEEKMEAFVSSDPAAFSQAWTGAFMRSPFVLGISAVAWEGVTTPFAPTINESIGFDLLDTEYNRLKMGSGPLGLVGGATGGTVNTLYQLSQEAIQWDTEGMQKIAQYRAPFINTLPFWIVKQAIEEATGD